MKCIAAVLFASLLHAFIATEAQSADVRVCFVPSYESCGALIVSTVDAAKHEVLVQAYGFSDTAIIASLKRAHGRGVSVRIILDKSNDTAKYSGATFAKNAGIQVLIDHTVAIAHNKVIIIDASVVITGSFNFTNAASRKNAENVVVITDEAVATQFINNWHDRATVSRPYRED